jgi:hypothetical protein
MLADDQLPTQDLERTGRTSRPIPSAGIIATRNLFREMFLSAAAIPFPLPQKRQLPTHVTTVPRDTPQ